MRIRVKRQRVYFAPYAANGLVAEITRRNIIGVRDWELRRAINEDHFGAFPWRDPWPPAYRECLNRWFAEHREIAIRWLFKRRCEKRARLKATNWSRLAKLYRSS